MNLPDYTEVEWERDAEGWAYTAHGFQAGLVYHRPLWVVEIIRLSTGKLVDFYDDEDYRVVENWLLREFKKIEKYAA